MTESVKLLGRLFISGTIKVLTGLHIGASEGPFTIGGVDKSVIINPLTKQPYIPGSSLRGKMRSLTEKYMGLGLHEQVKGRIYLHQPDNARDYLSSPLAQLYGITVSDKFFAQDAEKFPVLTRLIVRDVSLTAESARQLRASKSDLQFTEVKTEVSIDRITSQANPRQIERVPAGAEFGPMELVVSLYRPEDVALIGVLIDGMQLLEDDYLGGHGARGSGRIAFANLAVTLRTSTNYRQPLQQWQYADLSELIAGADALRYGVSGQLGSGAS